MINNIIKILKDAGVKKWKLIEKGVKSKELFFVKNDLDMNRAKDVVKYQLTVYKDFKDGGKNYMGSSTILIHPTMSEKEMKERVSKAIFAAGFVKNEPYPLAEAIEKDLKKPSDAFDKLNDIVDAIFTPSIPDPWLNSVEVFLNDENVRILNSNGLDVSFNKNRLEIEFITNSKGEKEEIELYWDLKTSDLSPDSISSKVLDALNVTVDRALAKPTPKIKNIPVIFDEDGTKEILSYYVEKASALNVYEHMSNAKIGEKIQGNFTGSPVTLSIDPYIDDSYYSQPFDEDGLALNKVKVIDNGTLVSYWGNIRFSHYLKVKPTGSLTNFVVEAGEKTMNDLRKDKYMELKTFSDFQVNALTGDFGGEIRLGWYHDGEKKIPITGGSVSGNVKEIQESFELSKETIKDGNYFGPKALKAYDVKIAGVK
ncbi:metallopeptidase TldD-related protein [Mesoaciditoga lauensis]|uniref:metallopeptidase TldD-related protein n=1 Tax=Mesoaciditoga lauensis TaxID=1495039 RepID=UPI000565F9AD|nr:metallopeptidase TldD-related protein [Mesoaciditoga lauensis]